MPLQFEILLQQLVEPLAGIGVPFVFALQFYFTGRVHKILDSMQELDEKLSLSIRFYRRCRKHCLFLIAVSLTEFALFINTESFYRAADFGFKRITNDYNSGIILYMIYYRPSPKDICNNTIFSQMFKVLPIVRKLSLATGIWVQLSIIAVLTVFCALVLVTALLAEELDDRTKEESFPTDKEALSIALDEWFKQLNHLHLLVEMIQDCFSPILTLTFLYCFIHFPYIVFDLMIGVLVKTDIYYEIKGSFFPYIHPVTVTVSNALMLSVRMGIIVAVCRQLKNKIYGLQNSLNRLPCSIFASFKKELQRENVGLQISALPEIKITSFNMFNIDESLMLKLLGVSLPYAVVVKSGFDSWNPFLSEIN